MAVDLTQFDDEFAPEVGSKVESLPDGDYDMEIAASGTKETSSYFIVETKLTVLNEGPTGGATIDHAWFIKDRDSANRFGKDLVTLGFDAGDWTSANGRPFSGEVKKAILLLPGLRFRAKKASKKGDKTTFHNLYLNKRLEADGKPAHFGAEDLNAAHAEAVPF